VTSKPHDSAHTHVTGKSEYVDDRPILPNELHVGVVYSEEAHAEILKIDIAQALKLPGVVTIYTAKDFQHLHWGTIFQDQPLLAQEKVQFVGEAIAIIAAESTDSLRRGLKAVKIKYKPLKPTLSIQAAIEKKSFIGSERQIERGDLEQGFSKSKHILEGEVSIHGADHFYLESQASIAYPTDHGGIEIHTSSQHPTEVQHVVAHALGIKYKDVVCVVKRMGGAFGGKESQGAPFAAYAALVAHKLQRPARIVLTKDDDMIMTGKRNPFFNRYRVGFDQKGKLMGLEVDLYSDGGAYADLSTAIMERAMLHCDNAYFIPNIKITGQVCKTNFHPHTAFRGFGGPKGVATIEKILEEVADKLQLDAFDVRKINCYKDGEDITPYGQQLENNLLPELFTKLEAQCHYRKRQREIKSWNESSKEETLRGLSLTAVKFGISFTTRFLNQGNALVNIHRDGTVQVSTGATEMGQGVYQRIRELVAEELGISCDTVQVMPTSTEKNANTSPTAASSGTDINGMAALLAAKKIKQRLSQVASVVLDLPKDRWAQTTAGLGTEAEVEVDHKLSPDLHFKDGKVYQHKDSAKHISFSDLTNEAFLNRVSLCEYAHYKIPHLDFNKLKGQGRAFLYFTQGVAATEVSVNKISGEVKILRTDILMDLGRPINEGLDIGQVSGAYIQGLGWVTTENLFYSNKGKLLSHSPSTYKIPNIQDTPRKFNISLIENIGNHVNVRGTKAVGEPPLLLSLSAWTAIRNAVKTVNPQVCLQIPATSEVVLRQMYPTRFEQWDQQ